MGIDEKLKFLTDADGVSLLLDEALDRMQLMKSVNRTEQDRRIAIAVTDLERLIAWWEWYVCQEKGE